MKGDYVSAQGLPAIRNSSSEDPALCPWCGNRSWFPSDGDDPRDAGRVQMYCAEPDCDSRETELIIVRGEGAHERADVRALQAIDEGTHTGDDPLPMEFSMDDPEAHRAFDRAQKRRLDYRKWDDAFHLDVP